MRVNIYSMGSFRQFVENDELGAILQQEKELYQQHKQAIEKAQQAGDFNSMMQLMQQYSDQLQALRQKAVELKQNLPPRNSPQLPDELNIDKLLGKRPF